MSRAAPLRPLLALALPMVLARASQSVITFADALQVEHLGAGSIAATATGGLNVVGLVVLPMGMVFIIQSFVSQLAGRNELESAPRFAWYALAIAAAAAIIAASSIPLIRPLLGLTGYSQGVQDQMTEYMAIRMLSVGAIVAVEGLGAWYGGLGNTWMQMVAGILTMVTAVFFNWLLIDGHLGAPALGVNGAAVASVIASWLGFAFLAVAFWRRWGRAPRGDETPLSRAELRRVVRFGFPNGLNWFLEFAAFQAFVNFVLGSLGDVPVAALNAVIAINSVSFMPAFGLASAGAILAGNAIGRGEREAVWPQVKTTLLCTMTWMGVIGALYFIAPSTLLELFDSERKSAQLVVIGVSMLMISAAWQLCDAIAMTISETLRAAGDTAWIAGARTILAWVVFVPSALVVVYVFDGGPVGAMLCLGAYIALLAAALGYRFKSGAWRRIELIEPRLF
jgi:MATE family, multidrug efflux pump